MRETGFVRYLIVVRHCEARPAGVGELDSDRPLSARGQRQREDLAEWWERVAVRRSFLPKLVLVSSARRTRETAESLRNYDEVSLEVSATIYNGSREVEPVEILSELSLLDSGSGHLAVVGHNPTLSEVIFYLLGCWPRELGDGLAPGGVVVLGWTENFLTPHPAPRVVETYQAT